LIDHAVAIVVQTVADFRGTRVNRGIVIVAIAGTNRDTVAVLIRQIASQRDVASPAVERVVGVAAPDNHLLPRPDGGR
jgi:hypothetical protein